MIVLGFDTATPSTAVGLRLADGRTLQARDDRRRQHGFAHCFRPLLVKYARGAPWQRAV